MGSPRKHTHCHRQHGNALIEMALVIFVLLTLMAGIFEIGRALWFYETLVKASRDAARTLSVQPNGNIATAGVNKAKDIVVDAAFDSGVPNFTSANVSVTCLAAPDYSNTVCTDGIAPAAVRVQVSYTMKIGELVPFVMNDPTSSDQTLKPSAVMRYMDLK